MNFRHFTGCEDMDAAKARFRTLAKQLHPDTGGDAATFRAMVDEFQEFQRFTWNNHGRAKWGTEFKERAPGSYDLDTATLAALQAALRFPGVEVEIIGTWLWARGETRACAGALKAGGWRWAPSKVAWCYHSTPYHKKSRRVLSWDEMRALFGSRMAERDEDTGRTAALTIQRPQDEARR